MFLLEVAVYDNHLISRLTIRVPIIILFSRVFLFRTLSYLKVTVLIMKKPYRLRLGTFLPRTVDILHLREYEEDSFTLPISGILSSQTLSGEESS